LPSVCEAFAIVDAFLRSDGSILCTFGMSGQCCISPGWTRQGSAVVVMGDEVLLHPCLSCSTASGGTSENRTLRGRKVHNEPALIERLSLALVGTNHQLTTFVGLRATSVLHNLGAQGLESRCPGSAFALSV
jgi:hypothetical protein